MAADITRKKRLRERYAGDLLWMATKAQYKEFSLMPFSEYDDLLEGRKTNAEAETEAIGRKVEKMLNMFG